MPSNVHSDRTNLDSDSAAVWELPEALRMLAECGDTELIGELIEIFQSDTEQRLQVLSRAVAAGDLTVVRAEAHTIKGSAVQVGAARVAEACKQMELEARKTPPQELFSMFTRLQAHFDEVCGRMRTQG